MDYLKNQDLEISSLDDIRKLETTPFSELSLPASTYRLFQDAAGRWPDQVALRFLPTAELDEESVTYTFAELGQKITQAANAFHALGVNREDCVSMMLPNLPETVFTIWGAEAAGIFNPLNPMLEVEHIAAIMNEARAKVLVTLAPELDQDLWSKASSLFDCVPSLEYILTVGRGQGGGHLSDRVLDFNEQLAGQAADALASGREPRGSDVASYFHTGGTTGTPKLAPHTHDNELISSYQCATVVGMKTGSIGFCGLPMFHVNGVFVTGLAPWMVGAEVILATPGGYRTPAVLANFWGLVEKYRINWFSGVPTILGALLDIPIGDRDVSSLDCALSGGAPLATEVFRKFEALTGLKLIEGYGQTEGTSVTSVNPKFGDRRIGSVGLRVPYMEVRVVDVDDSGRAVRDCDVNEAGSVAIRGPSVFSGYRQAEQNEGQWADERWFNTGDLGRLDEDGYLWLTGRSKDLIIRGGHNIDPQMIEEAYYKHSDVVEAAAIGMPDRRVGELPMVVLQMKEGASASEEELIAWGREHIHERAAVPKAVRFVEEMPITAVGKIFKPELRNAVVHDLVTLELLGTLDSGFQVKVSNDKKYGQSVWVTAPANTREQVLEALSEYSFKVWFEPEEG